MMTRIEDLECNRCHAIYHTDDKVLSVMYGYTFFAVCPACSTEIAEAMGYSLETITGLLSKIKSAETENNRLRNIDWGYVCGKCEVKFKEDEPRVCESSDVTNQKKYHLTCYQFVTVPF